jgi:hypothetical protein
MSERVKWLRLICASTRDRESIDTCSSVNGTEYIWFGDQPVAQTFTDLTLPTRYTFTDHLGTPILQTSPTGSIAWRVEYEASTLKMNSFTASACVRLSRWPAPPMT